MGKEELIEWIRKTKADGHSESEIYDTLEKNKYNQMEIQEAISDALTPLTKEEKDKNLKEKTSRKKNKEIIIAITIFIIMIIFVAGGYLGYLVFTGSTGIFELATYSSKSDDIGTDLTSGNDTILAIEQNKTYTKNTSSKDIDVIEKPEEGTSKEENYTSNSPSGEYVENPNAKDCGVSKSMLEYMDMTGGEEGQFESDEGLVCLGNALLNNCEESKVRLETKDYGVLTYELKKDESECYGIILYGDVNQIQMEDQKIYANTYAKCPLREFSEMLNEPDSESSKDRPGEIAFMSYFMIGIMGINGECEGTASVIMKKVMFGEMVFNISQDECIEDSDCDDLDEKTIDSCNTAVDPKFCVSKNITECSDDDGYCFPECTYNMDNDCENKNSCEIGFDCFDGNACTYDTCSGDPKKCSNSAITRCNTGDDCCPSGCTFKEDEDCEENE